MTKVVGIAIVRTGADLNEPIPVVMASDLASFGFFQRQVGLSRLVVGHWTWSLQDTVVYSTSYEVSRKTINDGEASQLAGARATEGRVGFIVCLCTVLF